MTTFTPEADVIQSNLSARERRRARRNAKNGEKSASAYRTISEVAEDLGVASHVLRFWESKFNEIQPMKRSGGRRYYRPEDIELLKNIQNLLHNEGYTIRGVQALLKKRGAFSERVQEVEAEAVDPMHQQESKTQQLSTKELVEELKAIRKILD